MASSDSDHLELQRLADACVQCGLCLPHCPTYADARVETESPRGRILLAKAIGAGRLDAAVADQDRALSHCLGCRACEAVCPAKVEYGRLLHLTRKALRVAAPPPRWQRGLEWLLGRPRWLDAAMYLARWLRPLPVLRRRLPAVPRRPRLPALQPAVGAARGRLVLVQGCVASHWEARTHEAALLLLSRLGWDVTVLAPGCCGALHRHAGNAAGAQRLRDALERQLRVAAADAVLHAGSGCHEAIASASAQPAHELCAFLADDERLQTLRFRRCSERVGLHVACTQRNLLRRPAVEAQLLQQVPGLELCTPPPMACCGAAGVQALRFPGQTDQRMQPLRDWYREQAPDRLLAGNLGCRLQLARQLDPRRGILDIEHPLSFLARLLQ